MGMKTGRIRYNLAARGRQFNGAERHFDLRATAAIINSPKVQEKVRNRDMLGYYGHWIRAKFGVFPPEWAMLPTGQQVNLEPAFITTFLSCDDAGNVEHEAEFLETAPGKVAENLHRSKAGGFSTAIDAVDRNGKHVPTAFGGFDYVLEPNYTDNRGYIFDSASAPPREGQLLLDSVSVEYMQSTEAMSRLFDSLRMGMQRDLDMALATIQHLTEQNEDLMSIAVRATSRSPQSELVLDSTGQVPSVIDTSATRRFLADAATFGSIQLPGFEKSDDGDKPAPDPSMEAINRHYGVRQ